MKMDNKLPNKENYLVQFINYLFEYNLKKN